MQLCTAKENVWKFQIQIFSSPFYTSRVGKLFKKFYNFLQCKFMFKAKKNQTQTQAPLLMDSWLAAWFADEQPSKLWNACHPLRMQWV